MFKKALLGIFLLLIIASPGFCEQTFKNILICEGSCTNVPNYYSYDQHTPYSSISSALDSAQNYGQIMNVISVKEDTNADGEKYYSVVVEYKDKNHK